MKELGSTEKRTHRKESGNEADHRFIAIGSVLIAVLLVAAILLTLRRSHADREAYESNAQVRESIAESEQAEAESRAAADANSSLVFELCAIPEINSLVRDYFVARLSADSGRIFEIFGRSDTSPDEDFEAKLNAQASWIQGYNNIEVYMADGEADNDYLCIVTYEIDFRRSDTYAPGIMYFFAVRGEDGSYTFAENLLKDKVDYANQVLAGESAMALIQAADEGLKAALESDSTLALIYVSFQNGEIYKEDELDVDAEQYVDFMDPSSSILVDEDVLADIAEEAAEAASREAQEGAADVYISYGGVESEEEETAVEEGISSVEWMD